MGNTIFIKFPWSKNPANEVYVSADQIRTVYAIIVKAFAYKYNYEQGKIQNLKGIEKYDLDSIKVYNSFIDEVSNKVFDQIAKDYIFSTLKTIRNNDFRKISVKLSYEKLATIFNPDQTSYKLIGEQLAKNPNKFIDFCTIFERCNKYVLTPEFGDFKELLEFYDDCKNSQSDSNKNK